jgi:hypothetical protein
MSLCSHTARAVSRSRVSRPNTLLPFLYQTATIQQWKPATQPTTRRNISSPRKRVDDIPFEHEEGALPPTIEEAQSARKTTITDTERAAFEKLYRTFKAQGQGRSKNHDGEHDELDQIADEYYEDDEDSSSNSLDKVFDAVLQGSPRLRHAQKDGTSLVPNLKKTGEPWAPGTEDASTVPDTPQNRKKLAVKAERERIKKTHLEERERVDELIKTSQTDFQVWRVLDREVFDQLRELDLDKANMTSKKEPSKPNSQKTKGKPNTATAVDTRMLFANYPHHVLTALQVLRSHFPRSPLPLTILPTIKALGHSSYALGATTQLYKHLLRTAWVQQSSYTMIDTLLADMDAHAVEFDAEILEMLDGVIREYEMARSGKLGRELELVYGMEIWLDGISKITAWRDVVAKKLRVQEKMVQDKTVSKPRREDRGHPRSNNIRHMRDRSQVHGSHSMRTKHDKESDSIPFVDGQTVTPTLSDVYTEAELHGVGNEVLAEQLREEGTEKEDDGPVKVFL